MTVAMRSGFVAEVPDIESRSRMSTNSISMYLPEMQEVHRETDEVDTTHPSNWQ
jgi:hypothetical protein